jgi:transposase InsO family protein
MNTPPDSQISRTSPSLRPDIRSRQRQNPPNMDGIIRFTEKCREDRRSGRQARPGPRPGTGSGPPPAPQTGPRPQRPSTPAATSAARHPHRRRTHDPHPTSAGRQRTRTRTRATDETDASHEPFAAHQRHQAQSQAKANAVAETFFATLKKELVNRCSWHSRHELQSAAFEYIEAFYNRQRRHSTLGMLSPADYEHLSARRLRSIARTTTIEINNQTPGVTQTGDTRR